MKNYNKRKRQSQIRSPFTITSQEMERVYSYNPKAHMAVWCSGNALVLINAVALHRARLVLGWVTAFEQVNYLTT